MKQKIFYILMLICCMSLFSSAKQSGKVCTKKTIYSSGTPGITKQVEPKAENETEFDLPPLRLLKFDR
jgi:hypothetical protein